VSYFFPSFYKTLMFPRYFVFAAALIVLSNEFFKLYAIPKAHSWIESSISIMDFCAEANPIARRLHFILTSFRDVVDGQKGYAPKRQITSKSEDPILNFLNSCIGTEDISSDHTRRNSFTSVVPGGSGTLTGGSANTMPTALQPQVPIPASDLSPERNPGLSSLDGSDSLGDGEIDFDAFWHSSPQVNPLPAGIQK
jgi:hypothetical protein